MKPKRTKVLLVSYHFFGRGSYRPDMLHQYFLSRHLQESFDYQFVCSDWNHVSKSRHLNVQCESQKLMHVPSYSKNFSPMRVVSHLVFCTKLLFCSELWTADLALVCAPPSLSAFVAILVCRLRSKPVVVDLIDLWPEALPAGRRTKAWFMVSVGWLWVAMRNFCFRRASLLLSHCKYFVSQLGRSPKHPTRYLPLAQVDASLFDVVSARAPLSEEIRILVLGSINHVLDYSSLVRIIAELATGGRRLILEIVGDGEAKPILLRELHERAPTVQVIDHGVVFDVSLKSKVLSRCHFGFNGYRQTSAIGITYKSIDFSSAGLVFVNSVQGDLNELVSTYAAGINYQIGDERELVRKINQVDQKAYLKMSAASQKMARDLFHPDRFRNDLSKVVDELLVV